MEIIVSKFIKLGVDSNIQQDKENIAFVSGVLKKVQSDNKPAIFLREQRTKLREDLYDLERCFVRTAGIDMVGGGVPKDSYKENQEEIRNLEILKIERILQDKLVEYKYYEKKNEEQNKTVEGVIDLLNNKNHQQVLKCIFIENMSFETIAKKMNYSYETIKMIKKRGIRTIAKIISQK